MVGIYKITSPTGKVYIGQSIHIEQRFLYYRNLNCIDQVRLYRSLLKHTPNKHSFEVIEECILSELCERERHWQEHYDVLNPAKGLNLRYVKLNDKSGSMSVESRRKMSSSKKGRKNNMFGKHHSEETKKKIAERQTGRIPSAETKLLWSKQRRGRITSDTTKELLRQSRLQDVDNSFKQKIKCPYCSKEGQKPNMLRWHFNNCKQK